MMTSRSAAFALSIVAFCGLGLRVYLSIGELGSIAAALSYLSQFFTILTNLAVAVTMALIASGRVVGGRFLLALTAAIVGVGLVYHAVLAQLWEPTGWVFVADHFVHTLVPLFTLLWWLCFARGGALRWWAAVACLVWPLIYCAYALFRAVFSGFYPYPFLNLAELGWTSLLINIVGLAGGFVFLGLVLLVFGKIIDRNRT